MTLFGPRDRRAALRAADRSLGALPGAGMTHDHDDHDHDDGHSHYDSPLSRRRRSEMELRAMALEAALVEKGLVATDAIDEMVEYMEHRIGPHHGARVVARAWTDPDVQAAVAGRRHGGHRRARHLRSRGQRPSRREHGRRAQPRRVHAVLVLPVAAARPAADLVQELRLPLAGGRRTASRVARVRGRAPRRGRDPRLGLERGGSLPRPSAASARTPRDLTDEELADWSPATR